MQRYNNCPDWEFVGIISTFVETNQILLKIMRKSFYVLWLGLNMLLTGTIVVAQDQKPVFPPDYKVDTKIDNMGYWQRCAAAGFVPVQPYVQIPPARYTGSKLLIRGVRVADSPDVCVTNEPSSTTQSENSIVINPNNSQNLLNSNNSTPQPSTGSVKGADALSTMDGGTVWGGTVEGAGGSNSGDPAAVIDLNGRWFVGFIDNGYGQTVAYSDNQGVSWTTKKVANGSILNMLDKNHLWVDVVPTSPYKNNLYDGWMVSSNISVSRSTTNGTSWSTPVNISSATAAGSHNQGINFKCGPDGEVYAAWGVYDNWPGDEKAIGFAKSLDGGATWQPAIRAINNLKGIRTSGVSQNMRVNSFPSMTCDISNSPYRGTIYVVWTNIGVPGVNIGPGSSVYMIKSTDKGATWSAPKRINSDSTAGKHHYLPWITCDQANGYISIVFYDNRNCASNEAEAWMAYSTDGGETFTDLKVSDVAFTPSPIPSMASQYMGDYLAIDAYNGRTYPCWTDTRSGHCLTYYSPVDIMVPVASIANTGNILNDVTFGNGNGLMDYGETELMSLKMQNIGTTFADSVRVYLSTDNPHITMLDTMQYYGHFEVDQEITITDAYKFKVSDSIANNEAVLFTVKAVDKNDSITWSTFQMIAHAPDVVIEGLTIIDPLPGGNGNGRLDPGETATLRIETRNPGIWDAENVVSHLTSSNPYLNIETGTVNIGTLDAGQTFLASFPVTVNAGAAIGSAARVHNVVTSKYKATDKYFNVRIGLIVEDWETGNFNKFNWQFTDPSKPWTIDPVIRSEGNYSARSAVINHGESSGLMIQYNCAITDSISFFKRVVCQRLLDNMKFFIDDLMVGVWSNNLDTTFKRVAYPVLAGPHTFKWIFEKDASVTVAPDASWVDFIVFPPQYKTTVSAGPDDRICSGSNYQLHGIANDYDSLHWFTTGDGQFSDPLAMQTVYTPGTLDIQNGIAHLTLTAYSSGGLASSSTMNLIIDTPPEVSAGTDGSVCAGNPYSLSNATATHATSYVWSSTGDGVFADPHALQTSYTPGPADVSAGTVQLNILATGSDLCPNDQDQLSLTVFRNPVVNLGADTAVCADRTITLDATTPGAVSYLWLPSNKTTPSITFDSAGIGFGSRQISVIVTGEHSCTGNDTVVVTFKVCGLVGEIPGVTLQVYPNPSKGLFTLEIRSQKALTADLSIITADGSVVLTEPGLKITPLFKKSIDLSNRSTGSFILKLSNEEGSIIRKLVVRK